MKRLSDAVAAADAGANAAVCLSYSASPAVKKVLIFSVPLWRTLNLAAAMTVRSAEAPETGAFKI
jgi:hypothetical protein